MSQACRVIISTSTREGADRISEVLLEKDLVAGSAVVEADFTREWMGKLSETEKYHVLAFSLSENLADIASETQKADPEGNPVFTFSRISSKRLSRWLEEETST